MRYLWILTLLFMGCDKDPATPASEPELAICVGLTEVELWGESYDIEATTLIDWFELGLTGAIPPEIGCLTNLIGLHINRNQLTGGIPPEIGNLTNLTHLSLADNQLTGEIPPEIGNLTNLFQLILFDNQLTGEIPPEIGNLVNLGQLLLFNNQLTGEIPPEVCALKEADPDLQWDILQGNNLIPCE